MVLNLIKFSRFSKSSITFLFSINKDRYQIAKIRESRGDLTKFSALIVFSRWCLNFEGGAIF